jgi:UDP-glucose 4-epimerase
MELIKAAHNLGGPQIKRFVLLSSAVAVLDSSQDMSVAGKDYTEEDWNPVRHFVHIEYS